MFLIKKIKNKAKQKKVISSLEELMLLKKGSKYSGIYVKTFSGCKITPKKIGIEPIPINSKNDAPIVKILATQCRALFSRTHHAYSRLAPTLTRIF